MIQGNSSNIIPFSFSLFSLFSLVYPFFLFQWCYPCNSSSTWSNLDGVACDDENKCTRGDMCKSGQCVAKPFTCDSVCHYCNGNSCSLKAGFGFANNTNCTCKIAGGCDVNSYLLVDKILM